MIKEKYPLSLDPLIFFFYNQSKGIMYKTIYKKMIKNEFKIYTKIVYVKAQNKYLELFLYN